MLTLQVTCPEDLLAAVPDHTQSSLEALVREALLVRLYAEGAISSGEGARMLGLSRRAFLNLLGKYNVSIFDESPEAIGIDTEVQLAMAASRFQH